MHYIVLDIEFNGRKFASDLPMEVIEIGAVRLDESLTQVDTFTAFIRPIYFSKLNSFIKKKTGIPQEAIDGAERFPKVIASFQEWLSRSEAFAFVTWGGEDMKRIVFDARMHKLDDTYWTSIPYYDLLKGYLRFKQVTNDVSVEAALTELNLSSDGSAHRALDDARMTADIFRAIFASLDLDRMQQFKDTHTNAKERRMIKQAVRTMMHRKKSLPWEQLAEQFLKDKITLDNPLKVAELQAYYQEELEKAAAQPKPSETEAHT